MSYTITITQKKEIQKEDLGNYCQVGITCLQAAEYKALPFDDRKHFELKPDGTYVKPEYAYPPKRLVTKTVETKIFEQTVEELSISDVAAVIISINGLRNLQ